MIAVPLDHHLADGENRATLVQRLRTAGCVFAEEEAEILLERAAGDPTLLEELAAARERGAPLEPLVGWVDFAGLRLVVEPGVFVPRQRTLRLLDRALLELRARLEQPTQPDDRGRAPVFVEAFAGVAPLATAVRAALPVVQVLACEQDPTALRCAAENLRTGGTACRSDVLSGLPESCRGVVDVVAAVPPYVPADEIGLLPREAREHEPLIALDGGADGLRWVRRLVEESQRWIAPGGLLLVELSEHQLEAATAHGVDRGWHPEPGDEPDDLEDLLTRVLALRAPG